MLLVETYLDKSDVNGIGLFAAKDIPKGSKIWEFTPGIDIKIVPERIASLIASQRQQMLRYTYINKVTGEHILCADEARHMNHSRSPNTINIGFDLEEGTTFAASDIKKGEEITTDYREFDPATEDYI